MSDKAKIARLESQLVAKSQLLAVAERTVEQYREACGDLVNLGDRTIAYTQGLERRIATQEQTLLDWNVRYLEWVEERRELRDKAEKWDILGARLPRREKLPNRRRNISTTFVFNNMQIDTQVGYYDDGRVGEVFMTTRKAGSMIDAMCRDTALLLSIALQHGASLDDLAKTATLKDDGAPDGLVSVLVHHLKQLENQDA